jgi:chromate transporter
MIAAFFLLLKPVGTDFLSIGIVIITFLLLQFTKVKTPLIILLGAILGFFI